MFDSKQYLAGLEPPTFIASDGSKFVGRLLSVEEWLPYESRMQQASLGEMTGIQMRAFIRDLVMVFFPRGWRLWTRRWWRPCWWYVRRLPPVGQLRAVHSFMESQREGLGIESPPLGTKVQQLLGISTPPASGSPSAGS